MGRHAALLHAEEAVQQVQHSPPPLRRVLDEVLGPDGEIPEMAAGGLVSEGSIACTLRRGHRHKIATSSNEKNNEISTAKTWLRPSEIQLRAQRVKHQIHFIDHASRETNRPRNHGKVRATGCLQKIFCEPKGQTPSFINCSALPICTHSRLNSPHSLKTSRTR